MRRLALISAVALGFFGCGKTTIHMLTTLRSYPPHKASKECSAAVKIAKETLVGIHNYYLAATTSLADGNCAVGVQLDGHDNILDVLRTLKAKSGFYSYIMVNKVPVMVWYDEPMDESAAEIGLAAAKNPSDSDCAQAAGDVAKAFPAASVGPVSSSDIGARHCYVRAIFHKNDFFESFFTSKNPMFRVTVARPSGDVTVWVHAIRDANQN